MLFRSKYLVNSYNNYNDIDDTNDNNTSSNNAINSLNEDNCANYFIDWLEPYLDIHTTYKFSDIHYIEFETSPDNTLIHFDKNEGQYICENIKIINNIMPSITIYLKDGSQFNSQDIINQFYD